MRVKNEAFPLFLPPVTHPPSRSRSPLARQTTTSLFLSSLHRRVVASLLHVALHLTEGITGGESIDRFRYDSATSVRATAIAVSAASGVHSTLEIGADGASKESPKRTQLNYLLLRLIAPHEYRRGGQHQATRDVRRAARRIQKAQRAVSVDPHHAGRFRAHHRHRAAAA